MAGLTTEWKNVATEIKFVHGEEHKTGDDFFTNADGEVYFGTAKIAQIRKVSFLKKLVKGVKRWMK